MGFRMRKSINLGGGVRLNVSHKGVRGVAVRGRHGGASVSRRGVTGSVGAKGAGYSKTVRGGSGGFRAASSKRSQVAQVPVASPPKPGLFAPTHEKRFYEGLRAYAAGDTEKARRLFMEASSADAEDKSLADDLLAGVLNVAAGKPDEAIPYLEAVVASDLELPDQLMLKYGLAGEMNLDVTERVKVEVEFGSLAAALALAECYQESGRLDEAIGVLQQLVQVQPDPALVLSLCELYSLQSAWDEIVEVAAGIQNEDDVSCEIRLLQAAALREQKLDEAALEAYKDALRSKKRDPALLREARYERGRLLLNNGKRAQGMRDLQVVYSEDPGFRDVRELVLAEGE